MSDHVHDIDALGDVIDKIGEATDSFSAEEAIRVSNALGNLARRITAARGLCETQAIKVLEGQPCVVDGVRYLIKPEGKWRPDQFRVKQRVMSCALYDTKTGERRDAAMAVEAAIDFMFGLYVAPATMPKTGGLEALGYGKDDVADYESQGVKLEAERPT